MHVSVQASASHDCRWLTTPVANLATHLTKWLTVETLGLTQEILPTSWKVLAHLTENWPTDVVDGSGDLVCMILVWMK